MTTIEIDVRVELADDADDLRAAIIELLGAAASQADVKMTLPSGRVLVAEAKKGDAVIHYAGSGKTAALVRLLQQASHHPTGLGAIAGLLETLTVA